MCAFALVQVVRGFSRGAYTATASTLAKLQDHWGDSVPSTRPTGTSVALVAWRSASKLAWIKTVSSPAPTPSTTSTTRIPCLRCANFSLTNLAAFLVTSEFTGTFFCTDVFGGIRGELFKFDLWRFRRIWESGNWSCGFLIFFECKLWNDDFCFPRDCRNCEINP